MYCKVVLRWHVGINFTVPINLSKEGAPWPVRVSVLSTSSPNGIACLMNRNACCCITKYVVTMFVGAKYRVIYGFVVKRVTSCSALCGPLRLRVVVATSDFCGRPLTLRSELPVVLYTLGQFWRLRSESNRGHKSRCECATRFGGSGVSLQHTRTSSTVWLDVARWPVTSSRRRNLERRHALLNDNLMSSSP